MRKTRYLGLAALLALAAAPVADAGHKPGHSPGSKACKRPAVNVGYVVTGTLQSFTADDPATPNVNEAVVVLTVKNANRHARNSGELTDQNAAKKGVQVRGGTYTLDNDGDAFSVALSGFEAGETPNGDGVADKVRIVGKVPLTRKRCASGLDLDARYGEPNVRRVKVVDTDA